ncbi:MAG: radical SAM family heme chaperone HemW [Bacteroidia bacterium]|nr:radical SAM family heme chaperone HemW [Bacteroidia bacterium]
MARLYIHIPFCRKACIYCDFHFSTSLKMKAEMVEAIIREIGMRKDFFGEDRTLQSIYFGGGTPSVLDRAELDAIFAEITKHFSLAPKAEISLEANPDDLSEAYLKNLIQTPVNRLSIGIQSFDEAILSWMNRSHNRAQAISAVEMAREVGFENLSGDLILGIPGQSEEAWEANLKQFAKWKLPHLSVYSLAVEEKTVLAHQVNHGKTLLPDDSLYERQFIQAHEFFSEAGYEHYELSNYALPGMRANHNSSYWKSEAYLGIGPSAHSYNGVERSWNLANNALYMKEINRGKLPIAEKESLTQEDHYHEYLMTHWRKYEGVSVSHISSHFQVDWLAEHKVALEKWMNSGHLVKEGDQIRCKPEAWLISDDIISDFF